MVCFGPLSSPAYITRGGEYSQYTFSPRDAEVDCTPLTDIEINSNIIACNVIVFPSEKNACSKHARVITHWPLMFNNNGMAIEYHEPNSPSVAHHEQESFCKRGN